MIKCYKCVFYKHKGNRHECLKNKNVTVYGQLQNEIVNLCGHYEALVYGKKKKSKS